MEENLDEYEAISKKLSLAPWEQTVKTAYLLLPHLMYRVTALHRSRTKQREVKWPRLEFREAMENAAEALLTAAQLNNLANTGLYSPDRDAYKLVQHRDCAFTQLDYRSRRVRYEAQEIISIAFTDYGKTVEALLGDDLEKQAKIAGNPIGCHENRMTALHALAAEALAMACSIGAINPPKYLFD